MSEVEITEILDGNEFVRHSDPETSHVAAAANKAAREAIEIKLLRCYAHAAAWNQDGLTDEEALIQAGYDMSQDGARRRCSTLRSKGQIAQVYVGPVKVQRLGRAGLPRIVCAVTGVGLDRLDQVDAVGG